MRRRRALLTLAALPFSLGALRPSRRAMAAAEPRAPTLLATAPDGISSFLADRDYLYWSNKRGLFRLARRGGQATAISDLPSLNLQAIAAGRLFFQESKPGNSSLIDPVFSWKAIPVGGGPVTTLVAERRWSHCAAADASGFYFMEMEREARFFLLFQLPLPPSPAGGKPREVAEIPIEPGMMVADRTNIYFTGLGGIASVPKTGGVPQGLDSREDTGEPDELAADERSVYWTAREAQAIYRVDKDGRHQGLLVSTGGLPEALALGGRFVYYADHDGNDAAVRRVPKLGKAQPETIVTRARTSIDELVADERAVIWVESAPRHSRGPNGETRIMRLEV